MNFYTVSHSEAVELHSAFYSFTINYIFMYPSTTKSINSVTELKLEKRLSLSPLLWLMCPLPEFHRFSLTNTVGFLKCKHWSFSDLRTVPPSQPLELKFNSNKMGYRLCYRIAISVFCCSLDNSVTLQGLEITSFERAELTWGPLLVSNDISATVSGGRAWETKAPCISG